MLTMYRKIESMLNYLEQDFLRYSKCKGNLFSYIYKAISNAGFRTIL